MLFISNRDRRVSLTAGPSVHCRDAVEDTGKWLHAGRSRHTNANEQQICHRIWIGYRASEANREMTARPIAFGRGISNLFSGCVIELRRGRVRGEKAALRLSSDSFSRA